MKTPRETAALLRQRMSAGVRSLLDPADFRAYFRTQLAVVFVEVVRIAVQETAGRGVAQRDYVTFDATSVGLLAKIPAVIGLKDGHGDLDHLQRLHLAAPADFLFFNGVATAEMQARAYSAIGVPAYSSAVHAFAPEISKASSPHRTPAISRVWTRSRHC
ncbi:dihydrodipicolinate synthase family protein [Amycolatopsis pithecellobii]|uniref:Uncharacterized protein n=1 Tax=Amycolatopsis pithecellobii TaxID=664692 RepID=A0A6N7Z9Q1_9PSEU|nr:dihydrodipicolinate synthase family protein [Amycolatopsis pithecellobii]MTD58462.1 hypothetical protein [Amycolatopsis pithecellobii]